MTETMSIILIVLGGVSVALLILLLLKPKDLSVEIKERLALMESGQERFERAVKDEMGRNREEMNTAAKDTRQELSASLRALGDSNARRMAEIGDGHKSQLDSFARQLASLTEATERRFEGMRATIETKLKALQDDNSLKLDQMRAVVDEKLQTTLEKRLSESFSQVAQRLDQVHQGLGEMQSLASGVGDLKKVLMNVKTRGTWAEVQLGNLLEQVLAPDQYAQNVATKKGSAERVEFAIRLPGRDNLATEVWLPIDAKFPKEDYDRLVEASQQANPDLIEEAAKQLERTVRDMAKKIRDKYLDPPGTTEFGIMYLPTEGLYAEVIRRAGLCDILQREYRVLATGPTTIWAVLNSLQMGFRTLAIEKRSSEVWELLGGVKTEFFRFGQLLDKTKQKLDEASKTIDVAARKSRSIEKQLGEVQTIPLLETGAESAQPLQESEELAEQSLAATAGNTEA